MSRKNNEEPDIAVPPLAAEPTPQSNLVAPQPLFLPQVPRNLATIVAPASWELNASETKRCNPISGEKKKKETKRLVTLSIPILASEVVVSICPKSATLVASISESTKVTRVPRAAILTSGSIQLKKMALYQTGLMRAAADRSNPNIKFGILGLRGVHVNRNLVFLVYHEEGEEQYAIYQTPELRRFLQPLALAAVKAYVGVPTWAVPIAWSGNLPALSRFTPRDYKWYMDKDGGFSSCMYAAIVGCHVQHKLDISLSDNKAVARLIQEQQPSVTAIPTKGQYRLHLLAIAKALAGKHAVLISPLVVYGLNTLAFNLVFRELSLAGYRVSKENASWFQHALCKTLLYNVTLREVDFSNTNLSGMGDAIGKSWAMNAQPLISRVNFSHCQLTNADLRGLLVGLARIWCGGTALMECMSFRWNPDITTTTWDLFFGTLAEPSRLPFWPKQPPPPPSLAFLQELNLWNTQAVGPGLVQFAGKLSGLQTLKLSFNGSATAELLHALLAVGAPLQSLFAWRFDDSCTQPILAFSSTLKMLSFQEFGGDPTPFLCGWPEAVPNLTIQFHGKGGTTCSSPDGNSFAPATIYIDDDCPFRSRITRTVLPLQVTGLKKLVLPNMHYSDLTRAAPLLALGGLETLHLNPKQGSRPSGSVSEAFWEALAPSKTLKDVQIADQLINSTEVAMIGRFLKANRSVARVGFDSPHLVLHVDSVKVLRSAFYGNKKVTEVTYLKNARKSTMLHIKQHTAAQLREVTDCKASIKRIFKSHYSKYNRNWRDKPNQLKLPFVERIRVAKRKIGKMQRDSVKIGQLLQEIASCIARNKGEQRKINEEKGLVKLTRRERQLQQLAQKKKKFVFNLVTKLHKAKARGRQKKSTKTQIPRSTYYKSRDAWPSTVDPRAHHRGVRVHSRYRHYNDPFYARYHWYYGYYGYPNSSYHQQYLDEDNSTVATDVADSCMEPDEVVGMPDETGVEAQDAGDGAAMMPTDDTAPCEPEGSEVWEEMMSDVEGVSSEPTDPWEGMDSLVEMAGDPNMVLSSEYLSAIHAEASELGTDVVTDISKTLDDGALVDSKISDIAAQTSTSKEIVDGAMVDPSADAGYDFAALSSTLEDLPDYDAGIEADADDADAAVAMYAGAGPRDLDDGGPSYGGFGNAVRAGARRRARARKENRKLRRVREKENLHLQTGYKHLVLRNDRSAPYFHEDKAWANDLVASWKRETRTQQIQAMAESNLFLLPEASEHAPQIVARWSAEGINAKADIVVVLVTQCSLDRLLNLGAQLARWTGKASIAVYVKPGESRDSAEQAVLACIENAKHADRQSGALDAAVTIVEGCIEGEAYPINFLRNVALLEARNQHLCFHSSLEKSAVLLVDVDFRPSINLQETLHSPDAANTILQHRRVVVCPAFEAMTVCDPKDVAGLKACIDSGEAEGFHLSHFPQGHSPTLFEKYWDESLRCHDSREMWRRSYQIQCEKLFEPYIVMASRDVPLYDERFQGYGLNKVSQLASVAKQKANDFWVLPGVFLVAPAHDRSESWAERYGSQTDETKFSQLWLKGLYYNFLQGLENNQKPVVSSCTNLQHCIQLMREREFEWNKQQATQHPPAPQIVPAVLLTSQLRA